MPSKSHSHHRFFNQPLFKRPTWSSLLGLIALLITAGVCGCAAVPLREAGRLASYKNLGPPKGTLARKRLYVDGQIGPWFPMLSTGRFARR
jgi:hypothetical protein